MSGFRLLHHTAQSAKEVFGRKRDKLWKEKKRMILLNADLHNSLVCPSAIRMKQITIITIGWRLEDTVRMIWGKCIFVTWNGLN
jgi:hypothetical protein